MLCLRYTQHRVATAKCCLYCTYLTLSLIICAIYRRIFCPSVLHSLPLPFVLFPSLFFPAYIKLYPDLSVCCHSTVTALLHSRLATYNSYSSPVTMVNKYGGSQFVLLRLPFQKASAVSDWVEFSDILYMTDAFHGMFINNTAMENC